MSKPSKAAVLGMAVGAGMIDERKLFEALKAEGHDVAYRPSAESAGVPWCCWRAPDGDIPVAISADDDAYAWPFEIYGPDPEAAPIGLANSYDEAVALLAPYRPPQAVAESVAESEPRGPREGADRHRAGGPVNELLSIVIPGPPVGAGRPRVVRMRNGASRAYMPDKSVRWEEQARQIAAAAWGGRGPLDEPVEVRVVAVLDRPRAMVPRSLGGTLSGPGEQRIVEAYGPVEGRLPCTSKPDIDNVVKLAMDALVKAGVLRDDTRVVRIVAEKWYAGLDEGAAVVVRVGR